MKLKHLFEFDSINNGDHKWEPLPLQIEETLVKECADYFHEMKGKIRGFNQLWRGTTDVSANTPMEMLKAYKNRQPANTAPIVHAMLNAWFVEKVGWPARNGVFATGLSSIASQYAGERNQDFAFFPVGNFEYVWSASIGDLYADLDLEIFDSTDSYFDPENDENLLRTNLNQFKWNTTGLDHVVGKNIEVMFNCEEYVLVNRDVLDDLDWDYIYDAI